MPRGKIYIVCSRRKVKEEEKEGEEEEEVSSSLESDLYSVPRIVHAPGIIPRCWWLFKT